MQQDDHHMGRLQGKYNLEYVTLSIFNKNHPPELIE